MYGLWGCLIACNKELYFIYHFGINAIMSQGYKIGFASLPNLNQATGGSNIGVQSVFNYLPQVRNFIKVYEIKLVKN